MLRPERHIHYRRAILSYYADMFEYGVDSLDSSTTEKQYAMLRYHLREDCLLEGVGIVVPDLIMKVWGIYTMLYDKLRVRCISIQTLDPDFTSFALIQQVSIVITHRSIHF